MIFSKIITAKTEPFPDHKMADNNVGSLWLSKKYLVNQITTEEVHLAVL